MSKHQWIEVTFGDLFEISSSKRVHQKDWKSAGVPFYRAREIVKLAHNGFVENDLFISEEQFNEFSENYGVPKAGDLMVSAVGTLGACYVVKAVDRFYYKDASVLRFSPKQDLCPDFIKHAFRTAEILDQVHSGSGSTVGTYTIQRANATRIRIPPLPEQRRIAAILDQAEALRTKRRAALAKLDTLAQSIFIEMFGDPVTNPNKWPRIPLAETCQSGDDIKCGPFGTQLSKDEFRTEGVPLWGIRNVNKNFEIQTQEFLDQRTANRLCQYSIEPGDIVMTRKGTIGNCSVYPDGFPVGIMHSDLLRLRVDRGKTEPGFLAHQLHYSLDIEHQISLFSGGAVMPGINVGRLKQIKILFPPFQLQRQFANRLNSLRDLKNIGKASLLSLDSLFSSLQHRAFRGEL